MTIRVGVEFSHFRILEEIGRGGMGVVYRAEDTGHGGLVAIKVLHRDASLDDEVRRRFLREAGTGAGLVHPSIVRIYESGVHEEQHFIALEYVDGKNLRDALKDGAFTPRRAVEVGIAAGDALQLAHNNGIVHRDIKAENIMLTSEGGVKVMDFGIAKVQNASLLTKEGDVVGTVAYMSPEQATGEQVDHRSDIFSLGVVLYELLTGLLPFRAAYETAILYSIINTEPAPLRQLDPAIPEALEQIVSRALRKERAERYQSIQELVNDLGRMKAFFDGERDLLPSALELVAGGDIAKGRESATVRLDIRAGFHSALAGREEEFARLKSGLEKTAAGEGRIAFIAGEPGIGKTRLVRELESYGRTIRVRMFGGQCAPDGNAPPYHPFSEAVRAFLLDRNVGSAASLNRFVGEAYPALAGRLPVLRAFLDFRADSDGELGSREQLWECVTEFFREISKERPILLFLDDLHWADEESLLLLGYLGRNAGTAKLMVLGTYRPHDVRPGETGVHPLARLEAELEAGERFERIDLGRLGPGAVGTMIESLFPGSDFGEAFRDSIHRETEGNPFFVIETLKLLKMEGVIAKADGRYSLREDETRLAIPKSIHDIVMRRIERLKEDEREILEIAAVEGESFHSGTIGACLELGRMRLLKKLQSLERDHHIIHPEEKTYRFDHGKIREFLYEAITPELRVEFHRMIGTYLAETYPSDDHLAAGIAHHFLAGGSEADAFPHLVRAGEWARRFYANSRAVDHYRKALEVTRKMEARPDAAPAVQQKQIILEGLADVWSLTGNHDGALGMYRDLLSLVGIPVLKRTEVLRKMGSVCEKMGENDRALEYLRLAEEELAGADPGARQSIDSLRALGNTRITRSRVFKALGRYQEAMKEIEKGLEMVQSSGNARDRAEAYNNLGTIYEDLGQFERAAEMYAKVLQAREETGDRQGVAVAWNNLANLYADEGDYARTADALQKSLEIMTEIGYRAGIAGACNNLGSVFQDQGRYAEALSMHRRCLALREEIGDRPGIAMSVGNIGSVKLSMGDYAGARADLERNISLSGEIGFRIFESQVRAWLSIALAHLGESDAANREALESLRVAGEMEQRQQLAVAKRTMGAVQLILAAQKGGAATLPADAEGLLRESLAIFEELRMKHEAGRSLLELARLYNSRGDSARCRDHLLRSKAVFQKLGALGDLAAANALHLKPS